MGRDRLPDRRPHWTQTVKIPDAHGAPQRFYLTVGEYPAGHPRAGQPGEIWIDAAKEGTFLRGVLGTLARQVSVSLQNGVPLPEVVASLRGMDYPPRGKVVGEMTPVTEVTSVADWIAQELDSAYLRPPDPPRPLGEPGSQVVHSVKAPESME